MLCPTCNTMLSLHWRGHCPGSEEEKRALAADEKLALAAYQPGGATQAADRRKRPQRRVDVEFAGVVEVSTILVFRVVATGQDVHVAADAANIDALVAILAPLKAQGVIANGMIHALGRAGHEQTRSDGTAIEGTYYEDAYARFPKVR